jgi:hypothetical protein
MLLSLQPLSVGGKGERIAQRVQGAEEAGSAERIRQSHSAKRAALHDV